MACRILHILECQRCKVISIVSERKKVIKLFYFYMILENLFMFPQVCVSIDPMSPSTMTAFIGLCDYILSL